jgi:hypothetical protein
MAAAQSLVGKNVIVLEPLACLAGGDLLVNPDEIVD